MTRRVLVGTGAAPDAVVEDLAAHGWPATPSERIDAAEVDVPDAAALARLFGLVDGLAGCVWPLDISEADLAEGDAGFDLADPAAAWATML